MTRGPARFVAAALTLVVVTPACANDPVVAPEPAATTTTITPQRTTTTAPTTTSTMATTATPGSTAAVALPADADLYAAPPLLTDEAPGTLLRYQPAGDDLEATRPGTLWRVMYVSSDENGEPIPVTGTIRIPDLPQPGDGWPVITWAHGTTGTADRCAPSFTLEYAPVPDPLVTDGYAIASTDYAGLGTPGLHPYLDGASEGRAVLDIVTAVGGLPDTRVARPFAVWGHSQGGHAALFARELAASRLPGHDLVGTIAFAPPSTIADTMTAIMLAIQPKGFSAMALAGIAAERDDARLGDILVPEAVAAIDAVVDTGCADDVDQALAAFGRRNLVVQPPNRTEPFASELAADEPATVPATGPLLLVHSSDDATVPSVMSSTVKDRTCSRGEPTLRWLLSSGGHVGIVASTWDQSRRWTLDRFAGVPAPSGCGQADGPPA